MTDEQIKKAEEKRLADEAKKEEKRLADEKAAEEKEKQEKADAEEKRLADEAKKEEKALKNNDTYIMRVSTLRWGAGNKKHFIGYQKPVISRKVMGAYHKSIDLWLKKKWIEKGFYPENKKKK